MGIEHKTFSNRLDLLEYLSARSESLSDEKEQDSRLFSIRFEQTFFAETPSFLVEIPSFLEVLQHPLFFEHLPQLTEVNFPPYLEEDLPAVFLCVAKWIQSERCRAGLTLAPNSSSIGDAGAVELAEALASGRCPVGPSLDLNSSFIGGVMGSAGAVELAEALASGRCPVGVWSFSSIRGGMGAVALAQAFESLERGRDLDLGAVDPLDGIRAFVDALTSRDRRLCPPALTLYLRCSNPQEKHYVEMIVEGLEAAWPDGAVPEGLTIHLKGGGDDVDLLRDRIECVLSKNNRLNALESFVCAEQFIQQKKLDVDKKLYDSSGMLSLLDQFVSKDKKYDQIIRYRDLVNKKAAEKEKLASDGIEKEKTSPRSPKG